MLSFSQAIVFAPFVLAVCVWVAWSDMATMKIPNKAVIALGLVWLVLGGGMAIAGMMDWPMWGWGFALAGMTMAAGFIANAAGLIGAGDAKFGAVMAPFFVGADPRLVMALMAACLLGAFTAHRLARMITPFRATVPAWASWSNKKFPMGLTLAGMLVFYLLWRLIVE